MPEEAPAPARALIAPDAPPTAPAPRHSEIRGAFGTVSAHGGGRDLRSRALALLAIMGPGLIVMVGDNDAGGVATYSQAGQNFGTSLLWVLLLLIPVLIVNQEMVIRLGAVTGVGHARLILERFGRFWGFFSVLDLFVLNFLTIVTEFIGITLALGYFGLSKYVAVPVAAGTLIAITVSGSLRSWERFMFVFVFANFLVIPLAILAHPDIGQLAHHTFVPGIEGGASSSAVLLIIAIVGTTVAPWQLFFQQSNIIDKQITPRWINYERAETIIGAFVVVLGAGALIAVTAFAFQGTPYFGGYTDAGGVATGLRHTLGPVAGAFYAIVLLNASMIGAAALTLSTSYAFGDVFPMGHSLNRSIREAKAFYALYIALVTAAAAVVLIPGAPLGVITTAVQALAGVLLPSATVFLLLLCNDREVLGPWVNRLRLNIAATVIIATLVMLSLILMATTVFPHINVTRLTAGLGIAVAIVLALFGLVALRIRARTAPLQPEAFPVPREQWTMPPVALLERPVWSPARRAAIGGMYLYLLLAVGLLVVKAIQLAGG